MVFVKIGTIVHFDDKSTHKKIQNDSDIFDAVISSNMPSKMFLSTIGADDCVEIEKNSLSKYLASSNEPLLKKAAEEGVLKSPNEVKDKESTMAQQENITTTLDLLMTRYY